LHAEFPLESLSYRYDSSSVEERGLARAHELVQMIAKGEGSLDRFLDLGSWDGMVCYHLQNMDKTAVGIDVRTEGYSEKAKISKTPLLGMDGSRLGFRDDSFDFAFSYNSFEHFPEPEQVLREATRVVRPGGYIYLQFGPLWLSPRGAHQFRSISVPYCERLFTKDLLMDFAHEKNLDLIDFSQMNEWTLKHYRKLWPRHAGRLQTIAYHEVYNADHVDLITRYPSCFKSKTNEFDDLIVSNIEVLFRKKG
jgi:SAM-dependent methyltransferase